MLNLGDPSGKRQILARIDALTPAARPRWGRLTAPGVVCHLSDSFRLPLGERTASMATGLFQQTVMKWGALYLPIPWPHNVPTRPEMEQGAGGSPPLDFSSDRAVLKELIARFSQPGRRFDNFAHPLFGAMTPWQWLRWGYLHADHHLRQFGV